MYNYFKKHFHIKKSSSILILLLILDFIFLLIDVISHYIVRIDPLISPIDYGMYYVTSDGGYAEYFQYFKYILIISTSLFLIIKRKVLPYIAWVILFTMLLLDDALLFHEHAAIQLIDFFNLQSVFDGNNHAQMAGEILYAILVGSILLLGLAISYYLGNIRYKNTCIDILLLFGLFIFFGVGVDLLHGLFHENEYIRYSLGVLEDEGEMIVLSMMAWYFIFLIERPFSHKHFLYTYFTARLGFLDKLTRKS